jgi:hypothetical protein
VGMENVVALVRIGPPRRANRESSRVAVMPSRPGRLESSSKSSARVGRRRRSARASRAVACDGTRASPDHPAATLSVRVITRADRGVVAGLNHRFGLFALLVGQQDVGRDASAVRDLVTVLAGPLPDHSRILTVRG